MIIGIDASRANEEKKTGVGWYAYHVIQEMKKITPDNIRVVLYTNKSLQGELADLPENWEEKVLGWKLGRLWTQVRLSWEMLLHAPDVLFIPAHVFPIIHPKKTVMTLHDIAAVRFPQAYNWFEKWYTLWSGRVALKKLWKVIAISNFTKSELNSEFGNKNLDKVRVIYLGFNKEYCKIKDDVNTKSVLNKYRIEKPFLFSIGRLETKKNTVNIVKAFEELRVKGKELSLVLVGGKGYGYEEIRKVIDDSLFKNDIITPGWVENNDLPYLMSSAEGFVFPSLYEGFGIPILEAMACGIPVITSKGSSLQEVGGGACIYIDPQDINEISEAIIELTQDQELRDSKISKGLERVGEFSWEKCAKETLDVLLDKN
jgi:glycosyltransferase involved in cell wall biosynthesis